MYNIQRWTKMDKGGHFAAFERPEVLVREICAFFKPWR
jgi:pimeloyl-ACP methyl ester carboxylesterase